MHYLAKNISRKVMVTETGTTVKYATWYQLELKSSENF